MEELEWLRVREGLLEASGTGLCGLKEALGREEREQLAGLLPRHRVTGLLTASNGLQTQNLCQNLSLSI